MSISSVNSYNYVSPYATAKQTAESKADSTAESKTEGTKAAEKQQVTKEYISNMMAANQKSYNNSLISGFNSANKLSGASDIFSSLSSSFNTLEFMKSGAYSKLINKYYSSMNANSDADAQATAVDSARKSAVALNKAADALSKPALYKNDSEKGRADILAAAKSFVSAYNDSINDVAEVDDVRMLQKGVSMVSMTSVLSGQLSKVGISVGEDNTLSIDEKTFSQADMNDLEAIFSGSNSYAARISQKAVMLVNNASISGYTANGSYNYTASTSGILNTMF